MEMEMQEARAASPAFLSKRIPHILIYSYIPILRPLISPSHPESLVIIPIFIFLSSKYPPSRKLGRIQDQNSQRNSFLSKKKLKIIKVNSKGDR